MKSIILFKNRGDKNCFKPTKPNPEASICLRCPFPDCNVSKCERFKEEMRKLKREKYGKEKKKKN